MPNATRERALKLATRSLEATPDEELALLTGERHTLVTLSETMGIPLDTLLRTLWSSEVVEYRAAHLISVAQQAIQHDRMQAQMEKSSAKTKGRRRRH